MLPCVKAKDGREHTVALNLSHLAPDGPPFQGVGELLCFFLQFCYHSFKVFAVRMNSLTRVTTTSQVLSLIYKSAAEQAVLKI